MLILATYALTDGHLKGRPDSPNKRIVYGMSPNRQGLHEVIAALETLRIPYRREERVSHYGSIHNITILSEDAQPILDIIDRRRDRIPDLFLKLSQRQCLVVLSCWAKSDGQILHDHPHRMQLQCDNMQIADRLQQIALCAGLGTRITMMKILGGAYQPEGGIIYIDGKEADVSTPRKALECGISVIYQELNYLKDLSIAENLFLGRLPVKGKSKRVDFTKLREESMKIQRRIGLEHCDPMMPLDELSIGEKQLVEIGKACARSVRVLVMDEPTSALNDKETERLFSIIESMKAQGTSVIYISHKLDEVMRISDRVQVMRDGCSVGIVETSQTTKDELVRMMVGREISDMYPISPGTIGKPILEVRNLNAGMLRNISFTLHAGEVLGLYGLMGAGCEEILQCIFGVLPIESGEVLINEKVASTKNPKESVRSGVVYVPSERKTEGLVLSQSVKANITLSSIVSDGCSACIISTHRQALAPYPVGRLLCGQQACPSRTLYRLNSAYHNRHDLSITRPT